MSGDKKTLRPQEESPPGMSLLRELPGHTNHQINELAWSPDGEMLASASYDFFYPVCIWSTQSGELLQTLREHTDAVYTVAWSPDGQTLASASSDGFILLWSAESKTFAQSIKAHGEAVYSLSWSLDGQTLASGSLDESAPLRLWSAQSGALLRTLNPLMGEQVWSVAWSPDGQVLASATLSGRIRLWDAHGVLQPTRIAHYQSVYSVAWSPDGQAIAAASASGAISISNAKTGPVAAILENHTQPATCVRFSPDGRLLASKGRDACLRLWRCDTWEQVAVISEGGIANPGGLAFHPRERKLATLGRGDRVIRIWELDYDVLLGTAAQSDTSHYRNAKVVLVGDSGVGKTGLGLVLIGEEWKPTESTHGRHVWSFESGEVDLPDGRREMRETLLWDLAGQPGYRLIHQLHLNEVAVALVVFDVRSETEPFSGVRHWDRALRQAQKLQAGAAVPLKKYLVAARADRGGIPVSRERIEATVRELGFDGYFETSAKEGWKIQELIKVVHEGISWDGLPSVSSNQLFQTIKEFLIAEKEAGRLLSTADDLYRSFQQTHPGLANDKELRAKFDTCVGRVENRGLIR
ncbi:MAG TPA: hypothetical protein VD861_20425, partial [Pyrinomonadaceae bacterium]|nr:hypothetical protein [Pyrinomonadaceae bacterium]